ncbi:unnamed protein product [Mytilus edulis]|uniref:Uncharacterized protein n=1 Tax=Mytilus edulis TaxID=6550 RepID=A0A8S3TY02_MYTED|nr:unnamed protein product [Mytilus edulis]
MICSKRPSYGGKTAHIIYSAKHTKTDLVQLIAEKKNSKLPNDIDDYQGNLSDIPSDIQNLTNLSICELRHSGTKDELVMREKITDTVETSPTAQMKWNLLSRYTNESSWWAGRLDKHVLITCGEGIVTKNRTCQLFVSIRTYLFSQNGGSSLGITHMLYYVWRRYHQEQANNLSLRKKVLFLVNGGRALGIIPHDLLRVAKAVTKNRTSRHNHHDKKM